MRMLCVWAASVLLLSSWLSAAEEEMSCPEEIETKFGLTGYVNNDYHTQSILSSMADPLIAHDFNKNKLVDDKDIIAMMKSTGVSKACHVHARQVIRHLKLLMGDVPHVAHHFLRAYKDEL
mmetsp:Transcript_105351/g.193214  ORF Transcript_105351/g.193214 Transcript_105351/m.193214 type:complete len:121 (-) Transcript_105351:91-453(-)